MSAQDNLGPQFDRWSNGECGTYATALIRSKPGLQLGVAGTADSDGGWYPHHYFAHDQANAYDSSGRHPLPYHGVNNQFDHVELGHDLESWGLPEDEGGDEDTLREATAHARKIGLI
jgi:hypothetical protein